MKEIKIPVGDKEKHEVSVRYKVWGFGVKIFLDGEELSKLPEMGGVHGFNVGDQEKHYVEIEYRFTGSLTHRITARVDGRIVYEGSVW